MELTLCSGSVWWSHAAVVVVGCTDIQRAFCNRVVRRCQTQEERIWVECSMGSTLSVISHGQMVHRAIFDFPCVAFTRRVVFRLIHRYTVGSIKRFIKRNNATRKNVCVTQHQPENIRSIGCFGLTIRVPEAAAVRTQRVETTIDPQNLPISDPPDQQKRERRVACMYVYM